MLTTTVLEKPASLRITRDIVIEKELPVFIVRLRKQKGNILLADEDGSAIQGYRVFIFWKRIYMERGAQSL